MVIQLWGGGAICPGICGPHHTDIRTRLFSCPGQWAHRLAQGNLEALWEGPSRGAFMRMGTIGWKLCEDVFILLVHRSDFLWACYRLRTTEDPFGYAMEWKLKPQQDPKLIIPSLDILVSMLPGNPHHAAKTPKEATRACPGPDAHCTHWTVQLSPNLLGSGMATIVTPLRSWISHRQLACLFYLAIACLGQGCS